MREGVFENPGKCHVTGWENVGEIPEQHSIKEIFFLKINSYLMSLARFETL